MADENVRIVEINGVKVEVDLSAEPEQALVVTTDKRGVFFGYGKMEQGATSIVLSRCRVVVYWSNDMKGLTGLIAKGPSKNCRIGPAAGSVMLNGVVSVSQVSPEAAKRFEEEPWG